MTEVMPGGLVGGGPRGVRIHVSRPRNSRCECACVRAYSGASPRSGRTLTYKPVTPATHPLLLCPQVATLSLLSRSATSRQ